MSTSTKVCSQCGKSKPRTDYYVAHKATTTRKAKIQSRCKDCMNTRKREVKQDQPRINRNRARHRAIADLIERHPGEFEALYEQRLVEAEEEAQALAQDNVARQHYNGEPVRLKPGRRRNGEKAGDRIDVARCPHCIKHHDRGHVCPKCGAQPHTSRRDDGIVDEVSIHRRMNGDTNVPLTKPERTELVRRCRAAGWSYSDIETVAGVPKAERYIDHGAAS